MKPIPTKAELRSRLEAETEAFLREGGAVQEVPRGVSGREADAPATRPDQAGERAPREERVYLNDVVAAIEARKRPQASRGAVKPKRPKRRLIYDDFGEPLRWEWVEE